MSDIYCIGCQNCKVMLAIGQSDDTLYSGQSRTMEALRVFLFSHAGEAHLLIFHINQRLDYAGLRELDETELISSTAPRYQIHYSLGDRRGIVEKAGTLPTPEEYAAWGKEALGVDDLEGVTARLVEEGHPDFVPDCTESPV